MKKLLSLLFLLSFTAQLNAAVWVPKRHLQLSDTPSSFVGQAGKMEQVNSAEDGLEFIPRFAFDDDYVKVSDYGACNGSGLFADISGVTAGTPGKILLTSALSIGATVIPVDDTTLFTVGCDAAIPTGGTGGTIDHVATITAISTGTSITIDVGVISAVSNSTQIYPDDTQAFIDALATGKNVYMENNKQYFMQGTWTMTTEGQFLVGPNWQGDGVHNRKSIIWTRNTTAHTVDFQGTPGGGVVGLHIRQHENYTPTAGAGIKVGVPATADSPGNFTISKNTIARTYDGLLEEGGHAGVVTSNYIWGQVNYCLDYRIDSPGGGIYHTNNKLYAFATKSGTDSLATLHIISSDSSEFINTAMFGGSVAGLHVDVATSRVVVNTLIANTYSDDGQSGSYRIKVESANTIGIRGLNIINTQMSQAGGKLIYLGPNTQQVVIKGGTSSGNVTDSPAIEIRGKNSVVSDIESISSSTIYAQIYSTATNNRITGLIARQTNGTSTGTGMTIDAGSANNVVTNNSFGAITYGTGTRSPLIHTNVGNDDYESAAGAPTSTPDAIDLEYLDTTNKIFYRSVGTGSSADWKAIQ